ncbi:MAG: biopolymer transporter Tol, partial [Methanotrichaceae archaeon]|nr:biopolymer transporter Tol [Methanotrichaceae archaeon]
GVSQILMRYIITDPLLLLETDFPSTNGSLMVWSDNRRGDWNIYGFDFFSRSERPISRTDNDQLYPRTSGDRAVWSDYRDGKAQIYLKNLTTGNESALTKGKGHKIWPTLSGDHVVYMDNSSGNWDVYIYDIKTGTIRPVYKGVGQQMYPDVSGDLVVWQDNRNGDWDIYISDLNKSEELKLTGKGDQIYPDVSGNTIVWEDTSSGDISYYLWDKKWGKTYPREGNQSSPVISGQSIAYVDHSPQGDSIRKLDINNWKDELVAQSPGQDKPNIDQKIVWLNTLTGRPRYSSVASGQVSVICKAPGDQSHPSVSGNYVTWMDNRSGNPDVYVYSLAQELEIPLAASPFPEMYPDVAGEIIGWMAFDPLKNMWAIRTFDVTIDNRSELVWGLSDPAPVSLSDQYLAYSDLPVAKFGWRVHKKLLFGIETAPAIPPGGINPRAGSNIVVYQDNMDGNGNWNVWMWGQGKDPVQLTHSQGDHINPATDGKTVVWQDNRNGNWDIYALDLNSSKEIRITKGETDQTNPDVENGVVIWQEMRNGNWDIYAYDMNTGKEKAIMVAPGNQTEPRIRTGNIVWTDDRSGSKDIYIYENYSP